MSTSVSFERETTLTLKCSGENLARKCFLSRITGACLSQPKWAYYTVDRVLPSFLSIDIDLLLTWEQLGLPKIVLEASRLKSL